MVAILKNNNKFPIIYFLVILVVWFYMLKSQSDLQFLENKSVNTAGYSC